MGHRKSFAYIETEISTIKRRAINMQTESWNFFILLDAKISLRQNRNFKFGYIEMFIFIIAS